MFSIRHCFAYTAIFCALAIVAALIMQHQFDMEPCPLCISQRIFIILVGIFALLGAITGKRRLWVFISASLATVSAIIGGSISARHVWLQNLPEDEVPTCGPGLSYMFETRPMLDALSLLFSGDGNCAEISFRFLGLSIPAWTFVCFVALAAIMIWQMTRSRNLALS